LYLPGRPGEPGEPGDPGDPGDTEISIILMYKLDKCIKYLIIFMLLITWGYRV